MAVTKWREYKVLISKSLVKRLAIIAWFLAIFLTVPALIMEMLNVDVMTSEKTYVVWCVCAAVALILVFSFYFMVYRGIRKRNISEISRVTSLIKAKLEAKIAKTAAMLTGALVFSFLPAVVLFSLGEVFPVLHTSTSFLLWETLIQLNSLVNPLLYCCRDRRFRTELCVRTITNTKTSSEASDSWCRGICHRKECSWCMYGGRHSGATQRDCQTDPIVGKSKILWSSSGFR